MAGTAVLEPETKKAAVSVEESQSEKIETVGTEAHDAHEGGEYMTAMMEKMDAMMSMMATFMEKVSGVGKETMEITKGDAIIVAESGGNGSLNLEANPVFASLTTRLTRTEEELKSAKAALDKAEV